MSTALDAILADFGSTLEITAEIDSAKRSDGTLRTWYTSTHIRSDAPGANPDFLPFIPLGGVLGPLSQSLTEDVLFSGLAKNDPGTLTLIQSNIDPDELSSMNDYVFAGYPVRIKVGRQSGAYSTFEVYRTVTVDIDPSVNLTQDGIVAEFQLASALGRMLEEDLIVGKYVGIPNCVTFLTQTGRAATAVAGPNLLSYSLSAKIRVAAAQASTQTIFQKSVTGLNRNWNIHLGSISGGYAGKARFNASFGGINTVIATSSLSLADGKWHAIGCALLDKTTAYLMVDRVVVGTFTPTVSVDLQTVAMEVGFANFTPIGSVCDVRVFDRYIPPDEFGSIIATRSTGELGCVHMWRFDDNAGATADDTGTGGLDMTIAGAINTDWKWDNSDLGEPELAGKNYPLVLGNVLNAKAQLISATGKKYRGNTDAIGWHTSTSNTTLVVRSQGTTLTGGGVDYTAPSDGGDGVFTTTAAEGQPVTYDLLNNGTAEELTYPSLLVQSLLTSRTRLTDISNANPMSLLCPWPSGYWTDEDATAQDALAEILGQAGMCYYEEPLGSLYLDFLLPPTGFGPYGEPCIDMLGKLNGGVFWGDVGDVSGSYTIAGWVKSNIADQTAYNFGGSEPNVGTAYIISKGGLLGQPAVYFQSIGTNVGKLVFYSHGTTLRTSTGAITPHVWHFFGCVFDDTANTIKIYLAPIGRTLVEVASGSNTLSPSTNTSGLTVGGNGYPWISTQHVHIWGVTKTLADLQTLMATPPVSGAANLLAYVPMDEGGGDPVEVVSQTSGVISGSLAAQGFPQWAPKLIIDLDSTPSVTLSDFHHIHPAWKINVDYAKNRYPMTEADIDTGVSPSTRQFLTAKGKSAPFESTTIRGRFKHAQKITLDSAITEQKSAQRLLRTVQSRFGTDVYVGTLNFPPDLNISRLACGLQIGDEIGLTGSIPEQIQTPRSFRVVAVAPNLLNLSTTIAIMG